MTGFAYFRLPGRRQVVLIEQTADEPQTLESIEELSGRDGFVVAPFESASTQPLVIIRPDVVRVFGEMSQLETLQSVTPFAMSWTASSETMVSFDAGQVPRREDYAHDFALFHAALTARRFDKLVLARCAVVNTGPSSPTPLQLFCRACQSYPQQFVALVYTQQSGLWLVATPEILLESEGEQWHTMALAGTMRLNDGEQAHWSAKNIEEQRIVARYIDHVLQPFASDVREEGPRTSRAGGVVHLRSDFRFTLFNNARVGTLLQALHPTPAVCGLPKEEARRFILANEHSPRSYYSGFMGPLCFDDSEGREPLSTHLYVTLRCMQLLPGACRLYAGGGLLRESTEAQEWQETEDKMQTMRRCLF